MGDTIYSNESAFQSAVSGLTIQNFAGIAPHGSFIYYGNGGHVTLGSVTYSSDPASALYIVDAAYAPSLYGFMGAVASLNVDYGGFNIANSGISGGAYSVGFTYNTINGSGLPLTISLDNGDTFTVSDPGNTGAFFGLVSTTPFTTVSLGDQGVGIDVGRFEYSTTSPVPEPSSLLLLGTGLVGGLGAVRRKLMK